MPSFTIDIVTAPLPLLSYTEYSVVVPSINWVLLFIILPDNLLGVYIRSLVVLIKLEL